MARLTNFRPYAQQQVEVGFVIVATEDSERGMVDIDVIPKNCSSSKLE